VRQRPDPVSLYCASRPTIVSDKHRSSKTHMNKQNAALESHLKPLRTGSLPLFRCRTQEIPRPRAGRIARPEKTSLAISPAVNSILCSEGRYVCELYRFRFECVLRYGDDGGRTFRTFTRRVQYYKSSRRRLECEPQFAQPPTAKSHNVKASHCLLRHSPRDSGQETLLS